MKKLLLVALIGGSCYILILKLVANFIMRDVPQYLEALKLTDADTRAADL